MNPPSAPAVLSRHGILSGLLLVGLLVAGVRGDEASGSAPRGPQATGDMGQTADTGQTTDMGQTASILDELLRDQGPDGGWGYRARQPGVAEVTAAAVIACHRAGRSAARDRGLAFLESLRRGDGFACRAADPDPGWMTAPVVTAMVICGRRDHPAVEAAVRWMGEGFTAQSAPGTPAPGWPWVDGTASWVEPTALFVEAMCLAGQGGHPRVAQALAMLGDRENASGGFSLYAYRPFLYHTARVVLALLDAPGGREAPVMERALAFLVRHHEDPAGALGLALTLRVASRLDLPIRDRLRNRVTDRLASGRGVDSLVRAVALLGLLEGDPP